MRSLTPGDDSMTKHKTGNSSAPIVADASHHNMSNETADRKVNPNNTLANKKVPLILSAIQLALNPMAE